MNKIKLMADYETSPVWDEGPGGPGDIDLETLPISIDLRADLLAWSDRFDATLDQDYPPDSGFATPEEEQQFVADGAALAARLVDELGTDWQVDYEPVS